MVTPDVRECNLRLPKAVGKASPAGQPGERKLDVDAAGKGCSGFLTSSFGKPFLSQHYKSIIQLIQGAGL